MESVTRIKVRYAETDQMGVVHHSVYAVYLEAARRLGVNPAACLVFEDILPGVRSARGGGMMTCAVRCADPRQPREALRHEADLWLNSWTDITL